MEVEPFVRWIDSLQIFFMTKNIIRAADKIKVVGSLLNESNILRFHANKSSKYLNGLWEDLKTRMFQVALPLKWRMELKQQIHRLSMLPNKLFLSYSTRARTLQSSAKFEATEAASLNDFDLAHWFEQRVGASFNASRGTTTTTALTRSTSATSSTSRDDFIWRVHAWLDSRELGVALFSTRKTYQSPGRTRAATVAGVAEEDQFDAAALASVQEALAEDGLFDYAFEDTEGCYGHLDAAVIAGLEEMHVQGWKTRTRSMCLPRPHPDWAENFANEIATS
ncbi:hypothetical protein Pst134EA_017626 [Puccinia striiformis f. sp. tritici]|uniref:hypothetical protein n=1 Tax=Puccinia striiformis f. sp. tritici TaxID=168172 RepID=UPI00200780EC|nr:hypothetical protein Pst134EA_017626 [Puccinia striiformis f. sp. tritici]KAH9461318.1 hypothetical protein Pst134EA_017626 [Puccinia striiformis f. sp. tritici]